MGPLRRGALCRPILFAAAALLLLLPILRNVDNLGVWDWDAITFYSAVPRETLMRHGQLPLWNPYQCGGNPLLANPQSGFLYPTFLLVLALGPVRGLKASALLHVVAAMEGTYVLARRLGLSQAGRWGASLLFGLGGLFASRIAVGHATFLPMALMPWALSAYLGALGDGRRAARAAAFLALMLLGGGVYTLAFTAMFIALHASFESARVRGVRPLATAAATLVLAFLLSAPKSVPLVAFAHEADLERPVYPGYDLPLLARALADRGTGSIRALLEFPPDQPYRWHEYYAYIGAGGLACAALGACLWPRREWPLAAAALVLLVLSFGSNAVPDLWGRLQALPLLGSLRAPSRAAMAFVLPCSLFAGSFVSLLERRGAPRALVLALVAALAADLLLVNGRVLEGAFPFPPPDVEPEPAFFQARAAGGGEGLLQYQAFLANVGIVNCYEHAHLPTTALAAGDEGYRGEAYLLGPNGAASIARFTPNEVEVRVSAEGPGVLVLNQNYDAGWTSPGRRVRTVGGLVGVDVGPGDSRVVLSYRPPSFIAGLLLSLAGVAAFSSVRERGLWPDERARS